MREVALKTQLTRALHEYGHEAEDFGSSSLTPQQLAVSIAHGGVVSKRPHRRIGLMPPGRAVDFQLLQKRIPER
jgi:hypothetical protein